MKNSLQTLENQRLTPQESARLRHIIAKDTQKHIEEAHQVVMGTKRWSPVQARVFEILLSRTVPSLTASFVHHEVTTRDQSELSMEDLERMISTDDAMQVRKNPDLMSDVYESITIEEEPIA